VPRPISARIRETLARAAAGRRLRHQPVFAMGSAFMSRSFALQERPGRPPPPLAVLRMALGLTAALGARAYIPKLDGGHAHHARPRPAVAMLRKRSEVSR